ncbi:sigma-E factor negative regulatory protein [Lysobacter panacisoli]|uniref:Sigma-E factor negative regulatory protein n=1 Tax=Lysobacter panacisoli TaxID=1255263 RepID=A0ABP9LN37_9GAMM|nr:sigma-E factor negative regulatory protein [Lysobacter panacisoli]
MTSNHRPNEDRETLSALFDSQLQGDEARFALRRLEHDATWRESCGRWQLYGDVMRGQAVALAAGGFAERVAAAIAQETRQQAAPVASAARPALSRRGWIGGALAASVAVVALFVTRPFSNESAPATPDVAPTQVASAAVQPVPAAPAPAPAVPARTPDPTAGLSAAAVAVAEVPRRAAERRASRGQSQRAALRTSRRNSEAMPIAASATPVAVASVDAVGSQNAATSTNNPFKPEHAETASRPWPRAVLPQYSGGGAMTASFGTSSNSPSFYPFEPQPAHATDTAQSGEGDTPQH